MVVNRNTANYSASHLEIHLVHLVHEVCVGHAQSKVFKTMAAETPIVADHNSYLSSACTSHLVQHNFILMTNCGIIMYTSMNPYKQ